MHRMTLCGAMAAMVAVAGFGAAYADKVSTVVTNDTVVTITVDGDANDLVLTDVYGSDIKKVIKQGKNIVEYKPTEPTEYGNLEVRGGQFRFWRADALGSGDVLVDGYDTSSQTVASLVPYGTPYTLTNKILFGEYSYFMPIEKPAELTAVGRSPESASCLMRLGRTGGGTSAVTLALAADRTDPVDQIRVRGTFGLTFNGGTVKVAAAAASPFVYDIDSGAYAKTYTVTPNGVAIDVAAGADVAFGVVPTFQSTVVTNCVETYEPSNNSFESGSTDWTFTASTNHSEACGVYVNGSAFDKDSSEGGNSWPTTNGTRYAMVRRDASLSRKVTLPTNGLWRMTFEVGCRPSKSDCYSCGITTTVTIDDTVVLTIPAIANSAGEHPFQRYETAFAELAAGEHTLNIALSDSDHGYASLNFDLFQFERFETPLQLPPLTKQGAGRLTITNVATAFRATVAEGTLNMDHPAFTNGTTVTVAAGATNELNCPNLDAASSISVASNGVLRLSDVTPSIVANGSFEAPVLGEESYTGAAPTGWTRSLTDSTGTYGNANGNGYQSNGSVVCGVEDTPYGNQTAYIRNYCKYAQTLANVPAGSYRLTFVQSARQGYDSHKVRTSVKINGNEIIAAGPFATGNYPFQRFTKEVTLTAGDHELTFDTTGDVKQQGAMVLIDDVRLERIEDCVFAGEVHMASGSTLVLDTAHTVVIDRFYVDGVAVNGHAAAIRRAGVTVEGAGSIRVGKQLGVTLILR